MATKKIQKYSIPIKEEYAILTTAKDIPEKLKKLIGKKFHCRYGPIRFKTDRIDDVSSTILTHIENQDVSEFTLFVSEEHSYQNRMEIMDKIVQPFSNRVNFIENRYRIDGLFQVYLSGYVENVRKSGTYDSIRLGIEKESTPLMITIGEKKYFLSSNMQNTLRVLLFVLLADTGNVTAMCRLPKHIKVVFEQNIVQNVPEWIISLDKALKKTLDLRIDGDYKHGPK